MILVALPVSQAPSWNFEWDKRACCCEEAGPCPCPDHELPDREHAASMRACGTGGNYAATVHPPELGFPPVAIAIAITSEPAAPAPHLAAPHAAPDVERARGPS